jgi:hypothetical protein
MLFLDNPTTVVSAFSETHTLTAEFTPSNSPVPVLTGQGGLFQRVLNNLQMPTVNGSFSQVIEQLERTNL